MRLPRRRKRHSHPPLKRLWTLLGPGLVTGAADDDPGGIATYSQAGAQFGLSLGWVMLLTWPLMAAIQEISARIGRVTGQGIAGNLRDHYPRLLLYFIVGLLLVANIINLGADLGAMADAARLLIAGPRGLYVIALAVGCAALQIFCSYDRYVHILKWLTFSLFAYVATVLVIDVPWLEVLHHLFIPQIVWQQDYLVVIVAVLGTTISPYLFFWQASEEAEDERTDPGASPLKEVPDAAHREMRRIEYDTYVGMALSNLIALCIIITTAVTLHVHGITNVDTSEQAANALRPIAGNFAFAVFACGIVGTGLLAIPVLAGSAAYAVAEGLGWPAGLGMKLHEAKGFYALIVIGTLAGIAFDFVKIDPIRALFWTAVINGVVAVPLMVVMMVMTMQKRVMGQFTLPRPLWAMGWLSTAAMTFAVVAMFVTWQA